MTLDRSCSMLVGRLPEFGLLLLRGFLLILGLPFLVRHAVDELPALVSRQRHAARFRSVFDPIRKTVAAEACKVHEINVLHIRMRTEVLDEPAECSGFELGAKLVVKRHGEVPPAR